MSAYHSIEVSIDEGVTPFRLGHVEISHALYEHSEFSVQIFGDADTTEQDLLSAANFNTKTIGIKVWKGQKNDADVTSPVIDFKGVILQVGYHKTPGNRETIILQGKGKSIHLDKERKTRSFENMSLKEIVDQISNEVKKDVTLNFDQLNSTEKIPYVTQYRETNYTFLKRLCSTYAEWFFCLNNNVHLGLNKVSEDHVLMDEEMILGKNLLSFQTNVVTPRLPQSMLVFNTLSGQKEKIDSRNLNQLSTGEIGSEMTRKVKTLFKKEGVELARAVNSKKELQEQLTASKAKWVSGLFQFSGNSTVSGIKLCAQLEIKNEKAQKVIGTYRVNSITHQLDGKGIYNNHFTALESELNHPNPDHQVIVPFAEQQLAIIKENANKDFPNQVRVQFLWQKDGELSPWIPISGLLQGSNSGVYMIPEIEDVVMVDFESNHPDKPYISGSFHTVKNKAPELFFNSKNELKGIKTRQNNYLQFDDKPDEEKIIIHSESGSSKHSVKLENGNNSSTLTISNEGDSATNSIVLTLDNTGGIIINSTGDIIIKSDKNIDLSAQEDISITSETGSISLDSAKSIDITSQGKISSQSSANTEIKGAIIKLN